MPGFTTNDEWGHWKDSGKIVFGAPTDAYKVRYQEHYAKQYQVPRADTLQATVEEAIKRVSPGRLRTGGEVKIPLLVWNEPSFQEWYGYQQHAGNVLRDARVLFTKRVGPKQDKMFCWIVRVSVYVTSEDRVKDNEFVIGRPDVSSVVLWNKGSTILDTKIVLVKEFRSPSRTLDSFLRENPGGPSKLGALPPPAMEIALHELQEETGFVVEPERLKHHSFRQLFGTLSSVGASVFSVEVTDKEMQDFKDQEGTERTYLEVWTLAELLAEPLTDWATLGEIFTVLYANGL